MRGKESLLIFMLALLSATRSDAASYQDIIQKWKQRGPGLNVPFIKKNPWRDGLDNLKGWLDHHTKGHPSTAGSCDPNGIYSKFFQNGVAHPIVDSSGLLIQRGALTHSRELPPNGPAILGATLPN